MPEPSSNAAQFALFVEGEFTIEQAVRLALDQLPDDRTPLSDMVVARIEKLIRANVPIIQVPGPILMFTLGDDTPLTPWMVDGVTAGALIAWFRKDRGLGRQLVAAADSLSKATPEPAALKRDAVYLRWLGQVGE